MNLKTTIAILVLSASAAISASAQGLQVTYGSQGLATLAYNGVTLVDTNTYGQDAFTVYEYERKTAAGVVTDKYSWDGGYTTSWNATTKTLTFTYDWGTVKCVYTTPQANRLTMTITVTNTTAGDTINGVNIFPVYVRFPGYPVGYDANTPHVGYTTDGPNVQTADYGSGVMSLTSDDVVNKLYAGFFTLGSDTANYKRYEVWVGSMPLSFQPPNYPVFNRAVGPGGTDTYTVSMRFGASGSTGQTLASDVFQNFATAWPSQVTWTDHRSIGALFLATSQTHPATNPRGWFLNDPTIDTTTPAGISAFQTRMLQYADDAIPILQNMNSQGMVVWDVEGQQYPQSTSYIGDPSQLSALAPEMNAIADQFFQKFRNAGLRVGVTLRPQHFSTTPSPAQSEVANPATEVINKINYAKTRWGCSLFYIDSNGDTNAPYDAMIFKQIADAEPDVLIMPEHENVKYYAYTVPYNALTNGVTGDPQNAIWTYPNAFSNIYTPDGDISGQSSNLVASVARGDILMYRGWWNDPQNAQVKSIYQTAGVGAPVITSAGTASGVVGTAFSYQIKANNGPASFAATGLPAGLTINTVTGLISGTPTAAATSTITISGTNGGGTGSKTLTLTVTTAAVESPYGGTRWTIPGTIQAENYDNGGEGLAYHDNDAGNTGGAYRSDNVDVRTVTSDAGGGYQVGWTNSGEYLKYMVNVAAAGTYVFKARVASGGSGGAIHFNVDGVNKTGTMSVPGTGSYDTFTTITSVNVALTAGQHTIQLVEDTDSFDINWFSVTLAPTAFNVNAFFSLGTTVTNGGADSYGNAYESNLLPASATYNTSTFTFGPANAVDAWANTTVNLPAGNYTHLNMLATAVGGNRTGDTFIVHYTDGTTQSFTKNLSDWTNPQAYTGETTVVTMANRLATNGTVLSPQAYIYGYNFTLNGKAVLSITLPATRLVVAFGFAGY